MEVLYPRCPGLDVHQQTVRRLRTRCIQFDGAARGTHIRHGHQESVGPSRLAHGAAPMSPWESTGVYWKPIWHVLDGQFALILANALQIRSVPGRKTDVNDAMWIADWLAHGLIRGSFVPLAAIHELRYLTAPGSNWCAKSRSTRCASQKSSTSQPEAHQRHQRRDGHERTRDDRGDHPRGAGSRTPRRSEPGTAESVAPRPHRGIAGPRDAASSISAAVAPHTDRRARGRCARRGGALGRGARALSSGHRSTDDHSRCRPHRRARHIIAEIGVDMSRFRTTGHLVSWAGLCPR
jgi:transposase